MTDPLSRKPPQRRLLPRKPSEPTLGEPKPIRLSKRVDEKNTRNSVGLGASAVKATAASAELVEGFAASATRKMVTTALSGVEASAALKRVISSSAAIRFTNEASTLATVERAVAQLNATAADVKAVQTVTAATMAQRAQSLGWLASAGRIASGAVPFLNVGAAAASFYRMQVIEADPHSTELERALARMANACAMVAAGASVTSAATGIVTPVGAGAAIVSLTVGFGTTIADLGLLISRNRAAIGHALKSLVENQTRELQPAKPPVFG